MRSTRRDFLCGTVGAETGLVLLPRVSRTASAPGEGHAGVRIGACVVGLEQGRKAGLAGIEVPVGGPADQLEISLPEVRRRYKQQMKQTGIPISSLMMGLLNQCALATDPRGPAWLEQSIDAACDLGAKVILVAFFGNGDLLGAGGRVKEADVDNVVRRLKAVAPRARDAGVVLGIENYLNAEQNARILDRVGNDSVKIYYDCYNTGATKGYDVPAEIRFLKDRIAQFHFKNGPDFLETGKLRFEPIAAAIKEIGYRGWIVLETSSPTGDAVADVKRNAEYTRTLFA
ncbi:MAG TPA: sugar phosphate isomerase/epimerase family protein [Isosphaeraceae bacterium]|nr:sugar phosphate isomerase/epimerase family protein [Isosphaeraceae bacterium]